MCVFAWNSTLNGAKPVYATQRAGVNKLKEFVSSISAISGVETKYTNHCQHATAMTRTFNKGVPEKIIAKKSGHRSLDGLRAYEHSSVELERAAGDIVADPTKQFMADTEEAIRRCCCAANSVYNPCVYPCVLRQYGQLHD